MNLLLADERVPVVQGMLFTAFPEFQGTLSDSDPVLAGGLIDITEHDLSLIGGQLSVTGNLNQRIDCRLRTIQGEWWLDRGLGTPFFTEMFKKAPDLVTLRQALLVVIQGVQGVTRVTSLVLDFDRRLRQLSVTFTAEGVDDSAAGTTVVPL